MRRGELIVLDSTTHPGTTDELVLEASGLKLGLDFLLAFSTERLSSEREDPVNTSYVTKTFAKLVGGVDEVSCRAPYAAVRQGGPRRRCPHGRCGQAHRKHLPGVNIALVNELNIAFDRMGIDIW